MTDEKRPCYVHCAQMGLWDGKDPPAPVHKTWCGRTVPPSVEWQFTDASHAILNGLKGGGAMLCTDCAQKIKDTLRAGTWKPRGRASRTVKPKLDADGSDPAKWCKTCGRSRVEPGSKCGICAPGSGNSPL